MTEVVVLVDDVCQPALLPQRQRVPPRQVSKKQRYQRRKYHYTCKPAGYFKGWKPCKTFHSMGTFLGFSPKDILESRLHLYQSPAYTLSDGSDLVEFQNRVSSIGLNGEFTLLVLPVHKKKIRCLSLFDGISGALYVLRKRLNLDIEAYFASEVDPLAMKVAEEQFPGTVIQLGDVRSFSKDMLNSLGRIDLLIGGSPCQDFSLVNPQRRNFSDGSSGQLLYVYKTIRDLLMTKAEANKHPFWYLYENTAHCEKAVKQHMCEILGQGAAIICQSSLTPCKRRRQYISNIPGVQVLAEMLSGTQCELTMQHFVNSDYFEAIRRIGNTVTSNPSNQCRPLRRIKDGKLMNPSTRQVECMLGFKPGYTDCGLSDSQRSKLLARGFSVEVLVSILKPLTEMYCVNG